MWDERYSGKRYAYGAEANEFIVSMQRKLPVGKVFCLAESDGSHWTINFKDENN